MKVPDYERYCTHALTIGQPFIATGSPGIGKTQVLLQIIKRLAMELYGPLYLGMLNEVDVGGMNYPIRESDGEVRLRRLLDDWLRPAFESTRPGVLVLDEFDKGERPVQSAIAPLFDLRVCGLHRLPDTVVVCATGNRREHMSGSQKTLVHLVSRPDKVELEVDPQAWVNWALGAQIAPEIISFIQAYPSNLDISLRPGFKAEEAFRVVYETGKAFENPRSWVNVSKHIKGKLPEDLETEVYTGIVGEGVTELLKTHLSLVRAEVDILAALSGRSWKFPPKERKYLGARFAFCVGVGAAANTETADAVIAIAEQLWDMKEREYGQAIIQAAIQSWRGLAQTDAWGQLVKHPLGQSIIRAKRVLEP